MGIKVKRSAVAGKAPTTTDLELGELALNTFDGKLYTKRNNGTDSIVEIGAGGVTSVAGKTGAVSLAIGDVSGLQTTLDTKQASLGFTPVRQGGGTGQGTNVVYIGWLGSTLGLQVDATNFGATWPIGVSGSATQWGGANKTVSTGAPSGGVDGDIWFEREA